MLTEFYLERQGRPGSKVSLDMEGRWPSIPTDSIKAHMIADFKTLVDYLSRLEDWSDDMLALLLDEEFGLEARFELLDSWATDLAADMAAIKSAVDAVPTTMVGTDDAALALVLGALADAAATGAVTESDTAVAYIKQVVTLLLEGSYGLSALQTLLAAITAAGPTQAQMDAAHALLATPAQVATALDTYDAVKRSEATSDKNAVIAAIPAMVGTNNAATEIKQDTIDGVVDDIKEAGGFGSKIARKAQRGTLTTGAHNMFTVTGDVIIRLVAVAVNSPAATGTVELGISGNTAVFIVQTNCEDLDAGEIWHDASPDAKLEALSTIKEFIITDGTDIVLTKTAAGIVVDIDFYCIWTSLSSDGNVVAA